MWQSKKCPKANSYQFNINSDNIRDKNAIWRLAAGFLKLLFPDLKVSNAELYEFCLKPALNL
ncbi:MAG: BREX system Lon protease-like protein BrxL [bacterium]